MTTPLKYNALLDALQQTTTAEFDLFRYNLRVRYAAQIQAAGVGSIILGGGTNFGSAVNSERTQVQSGSSTTGFPGTPATGTTSRQTYSYGQNRTSIPGAPTDFTNSYVTFANDIFTQEADISDIRDLLITPCITQMRTGDEVGTYRVAIASPGTGWVSVATFFRDSKFNNGSAVSYALWLRTSVPGFAGTDIDIFRTDPNGLTAQVITAGSPFEDLMFQLLVSRLSSNDLTYNVATTLSGINRGNFLDTRFSATTRTEQFINADDYRTTATPSGGSTTFTQYFLGLA